MAGRQPKIASVRPGRASLRLRGVVVLAIPVLLAVFGADVPPGSGGSAARAQGPGGIVVSGRLVDRAGHGLKGWVWLNLPLAASPSSARSAALARGRTDANGRFSLVAKDDRLARTLAARNGGWVNLDLIAGTGGYYIYRSIPRVFVARAGRWTGAANTPASLVVAGAAPGVAKSKKQFPLQVTASGAPTPPVCPESSKVIGEGDRETVVGELHTAKNQTATFTYGTSADSDVAVGFTAPGEGKWSLGGDAHVGNSLGSSVTWTAGADFHHRLLTNFHYVKRRTVNSCTGTRDTVEVTTWNGGETVGATASDPSRKCRDPRYTKRTSRYSAGGIFERHAQRAVRYGIAVKVFGVQLSATSGYSKSVEATWKFSGDGVLCGSTDFPLRAKRIFAGN